MNRKLLSLALAFLLIIILLPTAAQAADALSVGDSTEAGEVTGSSGLKLGAAPASFGALGDVAIDETNFPDSNFRAWLQNSENIGGAGSDSVLTPEEIAGITQIYMDRQGIRDLAGIELFTSLTALMCAYNYNSFTVPNGLPDSLTSLFFMGSELTALPELPAGLEGLNCKDNRLAELPPLPATLQGLDCSNNALTALDLSGLDSLSTSESGFNASGQTEYIALLSDGTGGFEAPIELNSPTFGDAGISYGGGRLESSGNTITETTFTVETGKAGATLSGTLYLSYPAEGSIAINAANFPDANFRAILKSPDIWSGIGGVGKDGYLSPDEIAGITTLDVGNQGIGDLTGIALFTALESLNCSQNALATLPALPDSLKSLLCADNNLTALPALPSGMESLYCSNNGITRLPVLPDHLIGLDCSYNPLTEPPALPSGLMWLEYAGLGGVLPGALPTTLAELNYSDNSLTALDLTGMDSLIRLDCSGNRLTALEVSDLTDLVLLDCSGNSITTLDVSGLSDLEELNCSGNRLTALDLSIFATTFFFDLRADGQTTTLALSGNNTAGYTASIPLNNPSGWAAGISYVGGILKSTRKTVTSTPFSVDTGLAGYALTGTLKLTYGGGTSGSGSGGNNHESDDTAITYVQDASIVDRDDRVEVDLTKGPSILSVAQLHSLVSFNRDRPVVLTGSGYTITFPRGSLTSGRGITDCDLGLRFNTVEHYAELRSLAGDGFVLMLDFNHSGSLPGIAQIRVKVGARYAGRTLYYYYYDPAAGGLEYVQLATVDSNGYVTLRQSRCSEYVLSVDTIGDRPAIPETGGAVSPDTLEPLQAAAPDIAITPDAPAPVSAKDTAPITGLVLPGLAGLAALAVFLLRHKSKSTQTDIKNL